MTDGLIDLYTRRRHNIYAKRSPHCLVMCKDAMTEFARTGRTVDHLFCLRPFTPRERSAILNDLIAQTKRSPHFTPLLLRDPAAMPQHQLIAYDELGLLICDAQTEYSLEGYSEIFLNSLLVARQFRPFMQEVLAWDMTELPEASIRFLQGLTELV